MIRTLLAKAPLDRNSLRPGEKLTGHTQQVLSSADAILDACARMKPPLAEAQWGVCRRLALSSAVFHDLGKANSAFQAMLLGSDGSAGKRHPIAHEILSAFLLTSLPTPLKQWCRHALWADGDHFPWWVAWVVGGHHLRLHSPRLGAEDGLVRVEGIPSEFVFYGSHVDVRDTLMLLKPIAGSAPPTIEDDVDLLHLSGKAHDLDCLEDLADEFIDRSTELADGLREQEKLTIALAKAIVVAADVAGSALQSTRLEPAEWISDALVRSVSPSELDGVIADRLAGKALRTFQARVAESGKPATVVVAGCGNGKTVGAYAWARRHAAGRKLFFCYPTTGTASAGFEDYLLAQTDLERALIHSRASVDLERMLTTYEDALEENQRLESLKAWGQQAVVCTVDTVLGLVQNQRRPLFSFPAIASGAFVFDEIHSYDAKLFGALLRFLRAFPSVPVLLMTASLSPGRLERLRQTLGERMAHPIGGEERLENLDRYRLHWHDAPDECWQGMRQALSEGRRVLWVCNTVSDAVAVFERGVAASLPVRPLVYHSRFRYRDRVDRQAQVLKAFRKPGPCLVIATQVCEMSLDISADLMITALPPFPSLVQRLGRLNRPRNAQEQRTCDCLVYDFQCQEGRPYTSAELQAARSQTRAIEGKPLSQRDLAEVLETIDEQAPASNYSAWLDGRWQSDRRPLREGGASLTLLLERDLPQIRQSLKRARPTSQNLAPWTVPMWYNPELYLGRKYGPFPVAGDDTIEYDEEKGARWKT